MKRQAFVVLAIVFLLSLGVLLSCGDDDDDSSGDDDDLGDDDNDEAFNSCDETATVLTSLDQVSDLVGISATDILDETGGGFSVAAEYSEDTSILTQTPLGGETNLTVTISYESGEIREIESVPADDGTGQDIAVDCRHRLEVEVTITVATTDGAFAETWQAVLSQSLSSEGGGLDDPNLAADFDPENIEGSFEIVSIEGPTPDAVTGTLYTTAIDPFQGEIDILVEQSSGEGEDGTVSQARHIAISWGLDL